MAAPSLELQIRGIHVDRAYQDFRSHPSLDNLRHINKTLPGFVWVCHEVAQQQHGGVIGPENAQAWAGVAQGVFKYLKHRFERAQVDERMLLVSGLHAQTRQHQTQLFMEAETWQASQLTDDAFLQQLSQGDIESDQA